jgi:hypothetical protein
MSMRTAHKSSTIRAAEGLTKRGFAEFVDNVDTRARRQIHLSSLFSGSSAAWTVLSRCRGRDTTVAIDNIDKRRVSVLPWKINFHPKI